MKALLLPIATLFVTSTCRHNVLVDSFQQHLRLRHPSKLSFVTSPSSSAGKQHVHSRQRQQQQQQRKGRNVLQAAATSTSDDSTNSQNPQAVATGYSQSPDLYTAIKEATQSALAGLPSNPTSSTQIDFGTVYVTSIYDSQYSPSQIVPAVLAECKEGDFVVKKLVGCYSGGVVGSKLNTGTDASSTAGKTCSTMESEGLPGVVVTLCVLPDTKIDTVHILGDDVPDDFGRGVDLNLWKNSIGLRNVNANTNNAGDDVIVSSSSPSSNTFMLLPSPSFQNDLDDFIRTMKICFGPNQKMFGALASTVSSLSRARLFRYDVDRPGCLQTLADGCVGVAFSGDIQFDIMVAQGAKPVGGVYRVVSGSQSTVGAIQLDEVATKLLEESGDLVEEEDEEDEEDVESVEAKKRANAALYAKAIIPKPVLAEANYIMRTLSDDDQAFMRRSLLVGLERSGGISKTPNELLRLAEGKGHSFTVHQVASAGMKDGSVTLPLGSVDVELGARLRFFVRDGGFAKKEIEALWTGYKKRVLENSLRADDENSDAASQTFNPAGCFFFPTLDRGGKFFGGSSYESTSISDYAPSLPSISGFFCNGAIAALDEDDNQAMIHGSSSCYVLIGSKSKRPIYSVSEAEYRKMEAAKAAEEEKKGQDESTPDAEVKDSGYDKDKPAPRSEDGELIVRRREVHSGRALTVSNVEWSVVENTASPTSVLEEYMWEKETEVDRLRERVPLSNLVSQCKLSDLDPSKPKPRDWIGAFKRAVEENEFVIIPEIKRLEPSSGSLRKRYDVSKLTKQMVSASPPALSVNCDGVLFGGSMEDISTVREKASSFLLESASAEDGVIAPPILASDLLLYPYQLYKLRLAGTDAVNIIVGALTNKDLLYLTKIAATLKLQVIASVTSEIQIRSLTKLGGGIHALVMSNRDLETFGFDDSGAQALSLLKSEAAKEFKEKFDSVPILVEGRVGIIEGNDEDGNLSSAAYVKALKESGAVGAIIGSGLVSDNKDTVEDVMKSLESA